MNSPSVYRTSSKMVIKTFESWKEAVLEWQLKRDELMTELDPTGKRGAMVSRSGGRLRFLGMEHKKDLEIPPGWRLDREYQILVPRRSTTVGKQIVHRIEEMCPTLKDPRGDIPGMPSAHLGMNEDGQMVLAHSGMERHGAYLYACWGLPVPPKEEIDLKIWKPVKLSAWYALLESEKDDTEA